MLSHVIVRPPPERVFPSLSFVYASPLRLVSMLAALKTLVSLPVSRPETVPSRGAVGCGAARAGGLPPALPSSRPRPRRGGLAEAGHRAAGADTRVPRASLRGAAARGVPRRTFPAPSGDRRRS